MKLHSFTDIITNSSSEMFLLKKENDKDLKSLLKKEFYDINEKELNNLYNAFLSEIIDSNNLEHLYQIEFMISEDVTFYDLINKIENELNKLDYYNILNIINKYKTFDNLPKDNISYNFFSLLKNFADNYYITGLDCNPHFHTLFINYKNPTNLIHLSSH